VQTKQQRIEELEGENRNLNGLVDGLLEQLNSEIDAHAEYVRKVTRDETEAIQSLEELDRKIVKLLGDYDSRGAQIQWYNQVLTAIAFYSGPNVDVPARLAAAALRDAGVELNYGPAGGQE
jgi:hypothetical protein